MPVSPNKPHTKKFGNSVIIMAWREKIAQDLAILMQEKQCMIPVNIGRAKLIVTVVINVEVSCNL